MNYETRGVRLPLRRRRNSQLEIIWLVIMNVACIRAGGDSFCLVLSTVGRMGTDQGAQIEVRTGWLLARVGATVW